MRVRVRIDPNCRFDIGERTPDRRSLVKHCVKAIAEYVGAFSGRPPGYRQMNDTPPIYAWADANWEIEYTLVQTRKTTIVNILTVTLGSSGNRL